MTARPVLRLLDTHHMLTTSPPRVDWIVDGVVARGTVTLLAGREKHGKSLFTAALAASVASGGGTVAGIECVAGSALIVDAENGEATIHRRISALGLGREHAAHIQFAETNGFDLRRNMSQLTELVKEVKPDLVVLDSWRSLWGGRENDSDEVAAVLDPLRPLARISGSGVILIHHMSRAGAYRGSTAAGASVENLLTISRVDGDDDRLRRCLRNTGCRYEEERPDVWLTLEADKERGAIYVDVAEPFTSDQEDAASAQPARATLAAEILAAMNGQPASVADIARAVGRSPKDGSVRNALAALQRSGDMDKRENRWCKVQGARAPRGFAPLHPPEPVATSDEEAEIERAIALLDDDVDTADAGTARKCGCSRPLLSSELGARDCIKCGRAA